MQEREGCRRCNRTDQKKTEREAKRRERERNTEREIERNKREEVDVYRWEFSEYHHQHVEEIKGKDRRAGARGKQSLSSGGTLLSR